MAMCVCAAIVATLEFGDKDQGIVLAKNLKVVEEPKFYPVVDAHMHIKATKSLFEFAVKSMDAAGIVVSVNLSGGSGKALEKSLALAGQYRGRFVTFCGGWPAEFDLSRPRVGEEIAKMLQEAHDMGAAGFGEVVKWGLDNKIKWDDARLEPVWAKLEELKMPINWHVADPTRYWRKETATMMLEADGYGKGRPLKHALIMQQERVLERHPKLVVIASHANWLNDQTPHLEYRFEKYPNYYIDLSAATDEFGMNREDFVYLCTQYADRIFFGTDAVCVEPFIKKHGGAAKALADSKAFYTAHLLFLGTSQRMIPCAFSGAPGQHFVGYVKGFPRYANDGINLPDAVLKKIYYRNAEKMFGIKVAGWKPKKGFTYKTPEA